MPNIVEQMAFYEGYHRSRVCKVTHYFGVPMVTFGLLVAMGWVTFPMGNMHLSLDLIFVTLSLAYFFRLEKTLAAILLILMIPVTFLSQYFAHFPFRQSLVVFGVSFLGGWVLQILGHIHEGRRPALIDNFTQAVFTAPLFLIAEVLFRFGWRKDLKLQIENLASVSKSQ